MTIIKRGLSQVVKDVKHIADTTSNNTAKTKKKKQESPTTSPKESQDRPKTTARPKRNSSAKKTADTEKRKKDKNSDNPSSPKQKSKRDNGRKTSDGKNAEEKNNKKTSNDRKNGDNKTENDKVSKVQKEKMSKDTVTSKDKSTPKEKVIPKDKISKDKLVSKVTTKGKISKDKLLSRDALLSRERVSKDKLISKEKLQSYGNYITNKLKDKSLAEESLKSKGDNYFKPPSLFGTLGYKAKPSDSRTDSLARLRQTSSLYRANLFSSAAQGVFIKKLTKLASKHSRDSKLSRTSISKKAANILTPKVTVAQEIAQALAKPTVVATNAPAKNFATPQVQVQVQNPSNSNQNQKSVVHCDPKPAPLMGSYTQNINLQDQSSSRYKRLKYQTGEELLKFYKDRVEKAIKDRKTFTVCGNFWSVRKALLARGWVEKINFTFSHPDREHMKRLLGQNLNELIEGVSDKALGPLYKRIIMSKMLGRHQVDLYWDYGYDPYKINPDNVKLTIINNIRRGYCSYSSKEGLCEIMKKAHWFHFPGLANIRHPRSYTLTDSGDPEEFVNDFRITAAMSMIKWIVATTDNNAGKIISEAGKVAIKHFHFALNECEKYLKTIKHEDIDVDMEVTPEFEWNGFLENYYRLVHIGNHFKKTDEETEMSIIHKSKIMINKLKRYIPYIDMDGHMNIWILKPTAGSRGIGIHICRTLSYVLRVVSERKTIKYVIQKYIERPLLIYNTKFDIRQWFLISCTNPLTIWMYKMCYLRFSSQTYNLRKLHESIHLTNNSVQCRYKNVNRDPALPEHNMWDSNKFKTYLETIGFPNAYDSIIYPGMKQCLTAAVLVQQEHINTRKNCFELYGADFMITEDFQPWLIEINSRPALYASTPVTGRMCPQVLEDVIKVIIDYPRNPKANTGHFELAYKEQVVTLPVVDTSSLVIRGLPLAPSYFLSPSASASNGAAGNKLEANISSIDLININNDKHYMAYASEQLKKTLRNLLEVIAKERKRRGSLRRTVVSADTETRASADTETHTSTATNGDISYAVALTKINEELVQFKEILHPKRLSDKNLDSLAKSLGAPTEEEEESNAVTNSTETDNIVTEMVDKSESPVHSGEISPRVNFELSDEEKEAVEEFKKEFVASMGPIPNNEAERGGVLSEIYNYLTFWKPANDRKISSAPTDSKHQRQR